MEQMLLEPCKQHQRADEWHGPHEESSVIYVFARDWNLERRYGHFSHRPSLHKIRRAGVDAESVFQQLARKWKRETRHVSSITRAAMHPAYQSIIGMGEPAVPLILRELREHGGHWLWALHAITRRDPAPDGSSFDEAVQAWLDWGRSQGYI